VTAEECPRNTQRFLGEERVAPGPRWYRQEYFSSFEETVDSVYCQADIDESLADEIDAVWRGAIVIYDHSPSVRYITGLDLRPVNDFTALNKPIWSQTGLVTASRFSGRTTFNILTRTWKPSMQNRCSKVATQ